MPNQSVEEWKNSQDFKQAVYAANKLLDEPYADPDDNARTVARQFNRMVERYDALAQSLPQLQEQTRAEIRREVNAIETDQKVRHMSDSGFWVSKELIKRDDVLNLPSLQGK